MLIKYNNRLLSLEHPLVMGIVNITPDSFYSGSRVKGRDVILKKLEMMVQEGVDIIDIGAYSSRPMAEEVSVNDEICRLSEVLEIVTRNFPKMPVSVDTFRSEVARNVVENFGVGIINDISGGTLDIKMFETISQLGVSYVLMHIRGNPLTMQSLCNYNDVVSEVNDFLQQKIQELHQLDIYDVIVDPGFGFAKTTAQNFNLLENLEVFSSLQTPLLVGISRKSMIYKTLGISPEEALNGSTALNFAALMKGANILRVHDVKEAKEAITLFEAMMC